MRGYKGFNFPAFHDAARVLRRAGWDVFSPAERDEGDEWLKLQQSRENAEKGVSDVGLAYFMQYDLAAVCNSQAVWVLPRWEKSQGAQLEVHVAHEVGIPVYRYEDMTEVYPPEPAREITSLDFGPEQRATDPVTGGKKGRKQAVFAHIPVYAQVMKARVHGFGVFKYPDEGTQPNWKKGMPWSWMYDAAMRHLLAFWAGETINPESGLPHLAHAAWMLDTLMEYEHKQLGTDDRPTNG
jgi:hypothetical protein